MEILFEDESKNKFFFCFKDSDSIPKDLIDNKLFNGAVKTSYIAINENNEITMWIGLGLQEEATPYSLYHSGMHSIEKIAKPRNIDNVKVHFAPEIQQEDVFFLAEGIISASSYTYTMKSDSEESLDLTHIVFDGFQNIVQTASLIAQARNISKKMIDTPPNYMYPETFVEYVKHTFEKLDIEIDVWNQDKLVEEKMEGLLNVGKGSNKEPYLLKLKYSPSGAKKNLCLIGKGITFDSGGYSLKPTENMKNMKMDLGGAASVVGVLFGIATLGLTIETTAYLPLAENMIGESAYKLGDVLKYRNGKTVEITNTDAEGRLVLADALTLAGEEEFSLVIDIATLTGAIVVALGDKIHGVFSNEKGKNYAQQYVQFSQEKTADPAWQMPLHKEYLSSLKSGMADLQNSGGRAAGATVAALFLSEFVPKTQAWMHLDIAGSAFDEKKNITGKATGSPVEALLLFLATKFLEI